MSRNGLGAAIQKAKELTEGCSRDWDILLEDRGLGRSRLLNRSWPWSRDLDGVTLEGDSNALRRINWPGLSRGYASDPRSAKR